MKNKPVLILGSGGHASVLLDILKNLKYEIIGFVSPDQKVSRPIFEGLKQFYNDSEVFEFDKDEIELVNGLGSLPNNNARHQLYNKFKKKQYNFATVIASSAEISKYSQIKNGAQILHGSVIQAGAQIGENTIVNSKCTIEHDSFIGINNHIAPSSTICGGVKTGENVHVGTAAVIIQSISIGNNSIIGAGTVITKNIDQNIIVYPARNYQKAL